MLGFFKFLFFISVFSLYLTGCSEKIASVGNGISVEDIGFTSAESTSCLGGNDLAFRVIVQDTSSNALASSSVSVKLNNTNMGQVQEVSTGIFEVKNLLSGGPYSISVTAPGYCSGGVSNVSVLTQGPPCNSIIQGSDLVLKLHPPQPWLNGTTSCTHTIIVIGNDGTPMDGSYSETANTAN